MYETWAAMEELVKDGLVKAIGISNMKIVQIRDILSYAKIKPAVLQVEIHPYFSQERLVKFCKERNIAITCYSSLGSLAYVGLGLAKEGESCIEEPIVK